MLFTVVVAGCLKLPGRVFLSASMIYLGSLFLITLCCQFSPMTAFSSSNETFMHFAYGSNMLTKRIHFGNPTAVRRGIGKLKDYRLDFNSHIPHWNGCAVTIVPDNGSQVWGVIWEIDITNLKDLDRQEGVDVNMYRAQIKDVETPTGEQITCRLYEQVINPKVNYRYEDLPLDRRPSRTYLNCLLKGAIESELLTDYINDLKRIPHNNQDANSANLIQICE